jgi:tetratricopeptide (TPR) repeat protein
MLKRAALLAFFAATAGAAAEDMTYADCTAMVDRDPRIAEQRAASWQLHGGGGAAMHCHALALFALKRYGEAARVLDALGRNRDVPGAGRAELFDQAGEAWLLAGKAKEAVQSFSDALAAQPNYPSYLADRARARAMLKDWKGADGDLSAALLQDQNRADLLVLRASARWALGRKSDSAIDIVRALEIFPDYPPALLERGKLKYAAGDKNGARRDWKKAAASGQGQTAEDAKRFLAQLGPEQKPISAK